MKIKKKAEKKETHKKDFLWWALRVSFWVMISASILLVVGFCLALFVYSTISDLMLTLVTWLFFAIPITAAFCIILSVVTLKIKGRILFPWKSLITSIIILIIWFILRSLVIYNVLSG